MFFVVSGCYTLPDTGKVLVGSAQLSQTSSVRDALVNYLPGESEPTIERDLKYLDNLYAEFKNAEPDIL